MNPMQAELELSALGEHLGLCKGSNRHWFAVQCAAHNLHGFIVSRFVTTLVILGLLAIAASRVL